MFLFLLVIFVIMLWSLMRCNQVWVYTYLREKNDLCLTRWRCCCCFGGEGEDLTQVQLPHWLVIIRSCFAQWGRGSGVRAWFSMMGHPCSSSNGRWELLYHQLCFSLPSPSCVVRTSNVKKIKEKSNPLLWVCYPSKDTRPLSLLFAVRIELFFKLILPQRLLRNYFEYI